MKVTIEVPEDAFRTPKTPQQIEEDVRQAATMFWLARGELTLDSARHMTVRALPSEGSSSQREVMLYDLLVTGPNVGEDADFERKTTREP